MDGFEDLTGTSYARADLSRSRFTSVLLHHVVMNDVEIVDTVIDGDVEGLVINGVDVGPLIEAELDRRDPDRVLFRPTTADGFRAAWDLDERLWATTVERARHLERRRPGALHESVAGEWTFVQTLRHLAFASESWVGRCLLGDPSPWQPLSLPWDQMEPVAGVPRDRDARPTLDEALALRHRAMALVRSAVDDLTDERLAAQTAPLVGAGWPPEGATYGVRECLLIVLNEEWCHRQYAERDLAVLEAAD